MQTPALAIAWEIWRKNRRGLILIIAAIPVWALFSRALAGPLQPGGDDTLKMVWPVLVLVADIVPMWVSLLALGVMFCYTDGDTRRGAPQFPARLFTLPVRTTTLVTWPILYGVLAVLIVGVAWEKLVLSSVPRMEWMPVHFMPLIFVATAMVLLQAAVWSLPGFPANRLIILSLLLFGLVWLAVWPRMHSGTGGWSEERTAAFQRNSNFALVAVSALAYLVALIAVQRARRGGRFGWAALRARVFRFTGMLPRRSGSFGSPIRAQFWFEWRRSGWLLPVAVGFFMVLLLGPITWIVNLEGPPAATAIDAESAATMLGLVLTLPLWLSFVIGQRNAELELEQTPFQLLRPLANGPLVGSKLLSAAASAALSWLMVLLTTPIWLAAWCDTSKVVDGWRMLETRYSWFTFWAVVLFALVTAMAMTWRWLVVSLYVGLWGRPGIFMWRAAVCFLGGLAGLIFAAHMSDHPKQVKQWIEAARYLGVLVVLKGLLAAWTFRSAYGRGLLSGRAIVVSIAIWAGAVLCLGTFGWLVLWDTSVPKSVMVFGAVLLFPLVRLGLAPLALMASRHR